MTPKPPRRVTLNLWQQEGRARYGNNVALWKFKCPSCGMVQSAMDYRAYNIPIRAIDVRLAFSCLGRSIAELKLPVNVVEFMEANEGYGCNYSGGGLFRIAPLEVVFGIAQETGEEATRPMFDWADPAPYQLVREPS